MKLTEFLEDVGPTIAYYPSIARALGGVKQAILVCQLIYWKGKESNPDGWIYKSSEELEMETGLSYEEQKTARTKLVSKGVLEEDYKRLQHRLYFRVNTKVLNEIWEQFQEGESAQHLKLVLASRAQQSPSPQKGKAKVGNKVTPARRRRYSGVQR